MAHHTQQLFLLFFVFMAILIGTISSFQITNCSSNYISELQRNGENKAVIEFDESRKITFSNTNLPLGKIRIWCKSSNKFEKCLLIRKIESASETYCNYSSPKSKSLDENHKCENNNVKVIPTPEFKFKCEFEFNKIEKSGKKPYFNINLYLHAQNTQI